MKTKSTICNIIIFLSMLLSNFSYSQDLLRSTTYLSGDECHAYAVKLTSDSGYIICGTTITSSNKNIYLVKTDAYGDTLWTKKFGSSGNEEGLSVIECSNGGYAISGYTTSYGAGAKDLFIVRTNSDGTSRWTQTVGSTNDDEGTGIIQTLDGGFLATGYTSSYGAGRKDMIIAKLDSGGTNKWYKTYGTSEDETAYGVCQLSDSGYVICGDTKKLTLDSVDVYIVAADKNGDTLWTKIYSQAESQYAYSIYKCEADGFLIAGKTTTVSNGKDMLVMKIYTDGTLIWKKTFGGDDDEAGYDVKETALNTIVIAGSTTSYDRPKMDAYLICTTDRGDLLWEQHFDGGDNENDESRSICLDNNENIVFAGTLHASSSINAGLVAVEACKKYFPRTLMCSSMWGGYNDSLAIEIPVEPFPGILDDTTGFQKTKFQNYVKNGKFSGLIIDLDSILFEDVGSTNNNTNVTGSVLRDTLSAYITRLKTQAGLNRVYVWVRSTKDESQQDTSRSMNLIRAVALYNQSHAGKINGLYMDYEYWTKGYGNATHYEHADTGYVLFKRLLNGMLPYHADVANGLTFVDIYLNDLKRNADTIPSHAWLTDTLQALTVDTFLYNANTETFMGHTFHRSKCKLILAFYIKDICYIDCNDPDNSPLRFIYPNIYPSVGKRLELFGMDTYYTYIIPEFSFEDSVGTTQGKDNNYLGDWKNGGNGDASSCWYNNFHYFYQVDSIFHHQYDSVATNFQPWGTITIAGSAGFKYDKRSIDTLLTRDTILFSINTCIGSARLANNHIENNSHEKTKNESEFGVDIFPNPFSLSTQITYRGKNERINRVFVSNMLHQDVTKMFNINFIENDGKSELLLKNTFGLKGVFFCTFGLQDGSQKVIKLIIE